MEPASVEVEATEQSDGGDGSSNIDNNSDKRKSSSSRISVRTDENIEAALRVLRLIPRLTIKELPSYLGISYSSCGRILTEEIGLRRFYTRFIPPNIPKPLRRSRLKFCHHLERTYGSGQCNGLVGDEFKFFCYGTKHYKAPKRKAFVLCYFDQQGIVHKESLEPDSEIEQEQYLDILGRLVESIKSNRPSLIDSGNYIIYLEDRKPHNDPSVVTFLKEQGVSLILYPTNSPDLTPCDFFLHSRTVTLSKGFKEADIVDNVYNIWSNFTEEEFDIAFKTWRAKWRNCIVKRGGHVKENVVFESPEDIETPPPIEPSSESDSESDSPKQPEILESTSSKHRSDMDEHNKTDGLVVDDQEEDTSEPDEMFQQYFGNMTASVVVDLADSDEESGERCLNTSCKKRKDLTPPKAHTKAYYGLPNAKNLLACRECSDLAQDYFETMFINIFSNRPLCDNLKYPKSNRMFVLDEEEEEYIDEDDKPYTQDELDSITSLFLPTLAELPFYGLELEKYVPMETQVMNNEMDRLKNSLENLSNDMSALDKDAKEQIDEFYRVFNQRAQTVQSIQLPIEMSEEDKFHPFVPRKTKLYDKLVINNDFGSIDKVEHAKYAPPWLPSFQTGRIVHKRLKVGQLVYALVLIPTSAWARGKVIDISWHYSTPEDNKPSAMYKIRLDDALMGNNVRSVHGSNLAFINAPETILDVGTRVVGLYRDPGNEKNVLKGGVIGEFATKINGYKYLVFFEDGTVQYVCHRDIRLTCEIRPNVVECFIPKYQEFMSMYLKNFPQRTVVQVKEMDIIKVEHKGQWVNGRVLKICHSLIEVCILKDMVNEWMYIGSPRLKIMYDAFTYGDQTLTPPRTRPRIDHQSPKRKALLSRDGDPQRRAVAKKSTAKISGSYIVPGYQYNYDMKSRQNLGTITNKLPFDPPNPMSLGNHTCSLKCISYVAVSEEECKGLNPLVLPFKYGFSRSHHDNGVEYTTPCGKSLRSHDEVLRYTRATTLQVGVDHFDFDLWVHVCDEFVVPSQYVLMRDLSRGKENVPIPVINTLNTDLPPYMDYMTSRRPYARVNLNLDDNFLAGCDCTDDCSDKSKCACWRLTIEGAQALQKNVQIDTDNIGYRYKRLPDLVSSAIYECNPNCKCSKSCLNRVVQNPTKVKLQLFRTEKKGWGTRCVNDIPAGTFICVYNGMLLTEDEANFGGKRYGDEYFAELDYIEVVEALKEDYEEDVPSDCILEVGAYGVGGDEDREEFDPEPDVYFPRVVAQERKWELRIRKPKEQEKDDRSKRKSRMPGDEARISVLQEPVTSVRTLFGPNESVYIMDAKTCGNIGRYLNHSCSPNIFVQNVFVDTHDLRFPWIAFFALNYIKAGSELTWDYRYEVGSVPGKQMFCFCESSNCRGRLL